MFYEIDVDGEKKEDRIRSGYRKSQRQGFVIHDH